MRRKMLAGIHSSGVESTRHYARYARRSCLRAGVRRLAAATALGIALMALVAAPGALAAGQQHDHFRDVFTDVDDDFCETGQRIDIAGNVLVNEWQAPHKGDFKTTASGKITLTNPLTGDTAVSRFAGPTWVVNISGDPEGDHVQQVTVAGLPELWKLAHGRVLIRDAGYVVLLQTIEDDELVENEVLIINGPHPDLESDFELFCEVMPEALGIEG
jgi:hypothetical protein